jgi:hypothetical protein
MKRVVAGLIAVTGLSAFALAGPSLGSIDLYKVESGLFLIALLIIYYGILFLMARVPGKSELPDNEPPHGVSACEVYYIDSYKNPQPARGIALLTIRLLVKWAVRVTLKEGAFTVRLINREAPLLSEEECGAIGLLFKDSDTFDINCTSCKPLIKAFRNMNKSIKLKTEHIFKNDFLYNVPIFVVFTFYMVKILAAPFSMSAVFMIFMGALLYNVKFAGVRGGIVFGFLVSGLAGVFFAGDLMLPFLLFIAAFLLMSVFIRHTKPYSEEGEKIQKHLNSFKDYLSGKEVSGADNDLFCDFLPYAIAFKREKEWADYLKDSLNTPEGKKILAGRGFEAFLQEEGFNLDTFMRACEDTAKECF